MVALGGDCFVPAYQTDRWNVVEYGFVVIRCCLPLCLTSQTYQ